MASIEMVRRFMADVKRATLANATKRDNGRIETEVVKSLKAALAIEPTLYTELLMAFGGITLDPKTKKDTGKPEALWLKAHFGEKKERTPKATGVEAEMIKVASFSNEALATFAKQVMALCAAKGITL